MPIKENALSVDNICSIIDSCGENGVASFEFGDLKISFKDKERLEYDGPRLSHQGPDSENYNEILEELDEDTSPAAREDVREAKALGLMNAHLEDPWEAENLLAYDEQVDEVIDELERE